MNDKRCFVICPFGKPESEQRKRSDMLLEYVIRPAVEKYGYIVDRADLGAQPGIVTVHVIQHLIEDDLIVADITNWNPNVFYELAIRHAIRRPFIQLIENGESIPFNIQEVQTVIYEISDVSKIKESIEKIQKQIIYYEAGGKVTSPVSVAVDELIGTRTLEQFSAVVEQMGKLQNDASTAKELQMLMEKVEKKFSEMGKKLDSVQQSASKLMKHDDPSANQIENLSNLSEREKKAMADIRASKEFTMEQVMLDYRKDKT